MIYVLREVDQMILCMDFSSDKVKITGVEREKKKLRVTTSLESPISDLAKFLEEDLKNVTAKIDEIRVSGALENTFHKVFLVPDMKEKMLQAALDSEVTKTFGYDYQFKEEDLGEAPGSGSKPNRKMMAVGIKRTTLEELSGRFGRVRTKPNIYTTYPVALRALLDKLGLLSQEPLGFVEFDHSMGRIVVFKGKEIQLTREIAVADQEKDSDRSGLARDIYRTLLFYTETFPDETVTRLVLTGNSTTAEAAESLREKIGAEIILLNPGSIFQGIEQTSSIHPGCLGLALLDSDRCSFGFMPFSVQEKKRVKRVLALSTSACLGVFLIFALVISRSSLELRNLNVFDRGMHGKIRMKEDRLREMPLEFVSQSIETSQPPWSEILLELAAVVPEGVALKSFTMKKLRNKWQGYVEGVANGSDEINSLLQVEEIQNNFVQSPLFEGAKLTERELKGRAVRFKIIYQLDI
jgi:hypothetical protein